MPAGKGVSVKGKGKTQDKQAAAAVKQQQQAQHPGPSNEELAVLQTTELEVLASIFGSDFRHVELDRISPWHRVPPSPSQLTAGVAHQLHFEIILRPDIDELKSQVSVSVRFRLPIRYPILPPIINVLPSSGPNSSARGLSSEQIAALEAILIKRAKELAGGGEMIWEIVSFGQEWISANNLVPKEIADDGPTQSLEEEKRMREKENEEARRVKARDELMQRNQDEAERARKIANLIQQQTEEQAAAIKEEKQRHFKGLTSPDKKDDTARRKQSTPNPDSNNVEQWVENFIEPIEAEGHNIHRVIVGPLIRDSGISRTHLVEAAEGSTTATWVLESFVIDSRHYDLSSGKRRLQEVEWELERLRMLRADTLVNILASALVVRPGRHQSGRRLLIVSESVEGMSLRVTLTHCIQLPWSRVKAYLLDLIAGLDALHANNVVHRDICLDNIMLDSEKGTHYSVGLPRAKLVRSWYWRTLVDMNAEHAFSEGRAPAYEELPGGWEAAELSIRPVDSAGDKRASSYTRKRDIWQLGVVVLQMLFGADIIYRYSSIEAFFQSDEPLFGELGAHVFAFIRSMLEKSTRKRASANELKARLEDVMRYEEEEGRDSSQTLLPGEGKLEEKSGPSTQTRRRLTRGLSEQENLLALRPGSFWQQNLAQQGAHDGVAHASRYESDFEEMELLGKGAYGAVFRARNRLDGQYYAIKKIRLSSSAGNDERTLREISALSRLSHQNIVRYVTCWIQTQKDEGAVSSSGDALTSSRSMQANTRDFILPGIDDFLSVGHDAFSSAGQNIRFAHSDSSSDESDGDGDRVVKAGGTQLRGNHSGSDSDIQSSSDADSGSDSNDDKSCKGDWQLSKAKRGQSQSVSQLEGPTSSLRWLFIQMEFVENQTLRETIDRGLTTEDSWRLLRQIIEALAHVASLNIIHRDLKPSNILMLGGGLNEEGNFVAGDVKIGDFGLATTTPQQLAQEMGAAQYGTTEESTDLTTEIGTNLYIAPEADKAGSRYDHKVDIYAAGIIFFEMLASQRVYKTGMERISVLRDLRSPDICFPGGWNEAQMPAQTKVIRALLNHDPAARPSPLELLKSDLLPPKMEDEYIAECMRLISTPNSTYHLRLMDSLFNREEEFEQREARDFTFDTGSNNDDAQGMDNRFMSVACYYLRSLFHRRGAVEMQAPLLIPPNELYKEEQKPVDLLDKTGKAVQLPYDLVVPFARMVAHTEQQRLKRYAIAPVYRNNVLAGGQPRSVIEVDFDIVASEKTVAAEAEVLSVVDEIVEEVPGLDSSEWVVQISHAHLLDLLLERVPSQYRADAVKAIGSMISSSVQRPLKPPGMRPQPLRGLGPGVSRSVIDEIEMANVSDEVDVVAEKLQRIMAIDLRPRLSRAVEEIQQVVKAARHFGVQRRILLTPLLITNRRFYKDNVFFVVARMRGKRRDILASGGRYDALLKRFSNPAVTKPSAHAVGVQIGLGRIALALANQHELMAATSATSDRAALSAFTPSRCDVYVASGPDLLSLRMEICQELWRANISADLAYEQAVENSPELLAATCRAEGILFLVIARARHSSMVKVKSIIERGEFEVNRWELSAWLIERIARLRGSSNAGSGVGIGGVGLGGRSGGGGEGGGMESVGGGGGVAERSSNTLMMTSSSVTALNPLEAEVILPERYANDKRRIDKHGNNERRIKKHLAPIQENSVRQVAKVIEELNSNKIPIISVDFHSTFSYERLCAASVARSDDGLWKLFLESVSSTEEREYGRTIRRRVEELKGRAWLLSVRQEGSATLI